MEHKAPGKAYRKGISLIQFQQKFPSDTTAEGWFEHNRWGENLEGLMKKLHAGLIGERLTYRDLTK